MRACAALLATSMSLAAVASAQELLAPRWIQELVEVRTQPAIPYTLIPSGRDGVLLRTPEGLAAYSGEGRLRWRYPMDIEPPAEGTIPVGDLLRPMASTSDGGLWVLRQSPYPDHRNARVLRISASGEIEVDRDVSTAPKFDAQTAHMASDDSAAMLFWTSESDDGVTSAGAGRT